MTDRLTRNLDFLKLLAKGNRRVRQKIIRSSHNDLIRCLSDCCLNVIKGNVQLDNQQKKRLVRHRKTVRNLSHKTVSLKKKRALLLQKGGALPALLVPILSIVGSLLLDKISK